MDADVVGAVPRACPQMNADVVGQSVGAGFKPAPIMVIQNV